MKKHKCGICGNQAVWKMVKSPNRIRTIYCCQNCLPKRIPNGTYYDYSKDGFEIKDSNKYYLKYDDCLEVLDKTTIGLSLDDEFMFQDKFMEYFLESRCNVDIVEYNKVMSKICSFIHLRGSNIFNNELAKDYYKFYIRLKDEMKKIRFSM